MKKIKDKIIIVLKEPLSYVLSISIIIQYIYNTFIKTVNIFPDSSSYLNFKENIFLGQVNDFRTPIYPYFIKIIRFLFGEENLLNNIVYLQYIIFMIGTIFLYLGLKKIIKSKILLTITVLFYSANPFVFLWNNTILTESLSVSFMAILIYLTVNYITFSCKKTGVLLGIHIFLMIMLRPGYIYLIPVYILFYLIKIIFDKKNKKIHIISIMSIISTAILIIIYCFLLKINYGFFGISIVSDVNKIIMTINSDSYKKVENNEITELLNKNLDGTYEKSFSYTFELLKKYSKNIMSEYSNSAIKKDFVNYSKYLIKNGIDFLNLNIGIKYTSNEDNFYNVHLVDKFESTIYRMKVIDVMFLCSISAIVIIYLVIKERKIPYIITYFTVMILSGYILVVIASPAEFVRLFACNLPLIYSMIGYIIDLLIREINIKKVLKNLYIKEENYEGENI